MRYRVPTLHKSCCHQAQAAAFDVQKRDMEKKIFLTLRMAFSQMPSESDLWETCLMFPKQDRERGGKKKSRVYAKN